MCSTPHSSVHRVRMHRLLKSRHPFVPTAQQLISSSDYNNKSAAHWMDHRWNTSGFRTLRDSVLSAPASAPTLPEWPCQEHRGSDLTVSTPVSDVSAPAYTSGIYGPFQACECGTEKQTADHIVLQCSTHCLSHELHGVTVQNDETVEWLLNTCPKI